MNTTTDTAATPLPIDLEQLSDSDLLHLYHKANEILCGRNEAALPAMVLDAVKEALADEPGAPAPVSAAFTTTEWDDGFFWNEDNATVTLADNSTRTLDLSDHDELDSYLQDHSSWNELHDDNTLLVTFTPLAMEMDY